MPVLYPNAPQFHDLTGDDAVALVSFYDSLHGIDRLVNDWYDRPTQQKDNIFNVILYNVDQGLQNAQICVTRFEIDALYPARKEVAGVPSKQIERALSQSDKARDLHIRRFNEIQQEEQRQKGLQTAGIAQGRQSQRANPGHTR
ncbi:hypothetical protein [Paraburkholderia oxyphila]|uniref:hypothetical protein n=1 Tax=Paraburkholderia oxyphila TaxID=614212 RepID=UPI0004880510|nr:hypothetical protein [Paraburkholderia oxyphila]